MNIPQMFRKKQSLVGSYDYYVRCILFIVDSKYASIHLSSLMLVFNGRYDG
jgi:hypothetical protein